MILIWFKKTMEELDSSVNFNAAYSMLMNNFNWDMKKRPGSDAPQSC